MFFTFRLASLELNLLGQIPLAQVGYTKYILQWLSLVLLTLYVVEDMPIFIYDMIYDAYSLIYYCIL